MPRAETPGATQAAIETAERQRVARELHDTTSQLLVVLQLHLEGLRQSHIPSDGPVLDEMDQVIRDIHASIRKVGWHQSDGPEDTLRTQVEIARLFYSMGRRGR